jgi:cyanate permease
MEERPDEGAMADRERRAVAIKRLKDKREFWQHLVTYLIVNAALVGIWLLGDNSYFWPGWVIFGWGIGIAFHAWNTFFSRPISDADVEREMRKLTGDR